MTSKLTDSDRLLAFARGLGLKDVARLLDLHPVQCFQVGVGETFVKTSDSQTRQLTQRIEELERLVALHQKITRSLGNDLAQILGYTGPAEDGDALRRHAENIMKSKICP